MKVVLIGSAHPLRGGLAAYNERLARAFQDAGDEVTIYSFSLQYPGFLFPGKSQYTDEPAPKGLVIKTCINSINPFNWIRVGNEIKKRKPDLVICKFWLPFMGPCFGTILRSIKKNNHTRVISIIDNIIPHEKRLGDRAFANYFVKPVDGFIAMSRSVLKDLERFTRTKPKVFSPHPIYDHFGPIIPKAQAKKNLGLDEQTNYLLFFGFIRDYKGLDWLIEAFTDERFRKMNLKLVVAGEFYTDAKPYHDLIAKHKLETAIVLRTDFIPDSKVADYFCAADIIVQPYKDATQSGVTQIGYHFEKPMLVTDVGGLGEIIPHGKAGYVVKPSPRAIADALVDFYEKKREQEFIASAKEEKKKYSWQVMVGEVKKLMAVQGG